MRTAAQIVEEFKRTGRVWINGEMEFDGNHGAAHAYQQAVNVANACGGYVVRARSRNVTAFTIEGGDMIESVDVDWYGTDRQQLVRVTVWVPDTAAV